jgi:NitT/TauT family transport system substrate-binding protein
MLKRSLYFLAVVLLLSGCGNRTGNRGNSKIYIIATLKGPSSMGMIKIIDSLSHGTGYSVQVKIMNEPLLVRKMMLDGSADFAILPTTMAAIVYNKGLKYKLIGIPVWGTLHMVGSDTTIKLWKDLRGKRIYVMARGMTPDVMLRILLQKNGIDPDKDVSLDYSFPTHIDLANAIAAGKAGLGIISEPMASMVIKKNKSLRILLDPEQEWLKQINVPITETAFLGKDSVLVNNRDLVNRIILDYTKSTDWVNNHPDSAAALIVRHGILPDREAARNAISGSNLKFVRADQVSSQINEYLEIFYKMNHDIIGGKIPDENFIYR